MSFLDAKQQKPNPFELRKRKFFGLLQKNGIMKRSTLIDIMGVTVDRFQREYKLYLESFNGFIKYSEKTQSFLYDVNDFIIDYDYWDSQHLVQTATRATIKQQMIVS